MDKCRFCKLNKDIICNTVLYESNNFYVIPTLGSLVEGYVLIVCKKHITSLSQLTKIEKNEYKKIVDNYMKVFENIYGKHPILFEHGTPNIKSTGITSSVFHAHAHIVNHEYLNETKIIEKLNLKKISNFDKVNNKSNYIYFVNNKDQSYVSYQHESISQIMRIFIAEDLNIKDKYDWKNYEFNDNIIKMLEKIK